ncbi:hypothetical protein PHMEG_00013720 [Phytophthora megakarya]|uniref:Uncharacterized protein n=1 Tax=Phytophthora megakarya TaxID=4795 RepID=A0A225W628_9STRA|nr:hypothetical protein PHMEG_00013720 [Phytophthora megakarya]
MEKDAASPGTKSAHKPDGVSTCLYPSKRCDNPRAVKRNGELHNFCDFHRDKANYNQRRLEHKRKYQHEAGEGIQLPRMFSGMPAPTSSPQQLNCANTLSPSTTLEPDEIWILQELLQCEDASADKSGHDMCP